MMPANECVQCLPMTAATCPTALVFASLTSPMSADVRKKKKQKSVFFRVVKDKKFILDSIVF